MKLIPGIGIMPFQLLNIGSVLFMAFYRLFYTRTPRGEFSSSLLIADFAEIYAPPSLNYGTVYPQAILVFTICLCYSVVSPLILVFGSIYFGVGCEAQNVCADSRSRLQIQAPIRILQAIRKQWQRVANNL